MALTERDWLRRVMKECGGPLARPPQDQFTKDLLAELAGWVPTLWDMEEGRANAYLRFLYTKAGAIDFLRAQFYTDTDAQVGPRGIKVADSQIFQALSKLAADNRAEIDRTESKLTGAGQGADGAGGPSTGALPSASTSTSATTTGAGTAQGGAGDFLGDPLADPGPGGLDWL